ncbi:hypothetical protein ACK8P5_16650 [Paenibacillus sp. EC2-1]|uniref:hypothetical protein n=1 Tax=Paenibacillus sp. EC2-1 TaxID=3388665 RepID=UPI003BEF0BDF
MDQYKDKILGSKVINGPHGKITVFVVDDGENSTALSDLYDTLAKIMVNQAKRKAIREAREFTEQETVND